MFEHWVRSRATCAICCGLDDQASNWLVFTWPCPSSPFHQNTLASFFSLLRSSIRSHSRCTTINTRSCRVRSKKLSQSLTQNQQFFRAVPYICSSSNLHWLNRAKLDRFRAQLRCDQVSCSSTVASAVPGRTTGKTGKWGSANIL